MKKILLALSHSIALAAGFALGIYALPILIAPEAPSSEQVQTALATESSYKGQFKRELQDSDALHWGEGEVMVSQQQIGLVGELAPGPDYKLYLSPEFVETEADFLKLKSQMTRVGDIKTFKNFLIPVPESVDIDQFTTVIVWCETFGQFITAAKYR